MLATTTRFVEKKSVWCLLRFLFISDLSLGRLQVRLGITSCDVVLWFPAVKLLMDVFTIRALRKAPVNLPRRPIESRGTWPVVYCDVLKLRAFVPSNAWAGEDEKEAEEKEKEASHFSISISLLSCLALFLCLFFLMLRCDVSQVLQRTEMTCWCCRCRRLS
jgi:hypothetical protein